MAKYRKKPIVIEAAKFFQRVMPWPEGVLQGELDATKARDLRVQTLEGPMKVSEGDWIITGIKGETYPCKDDIFRLTYEPA